MELTVIADDRDVMRLLCTGPITQLTLDHRRDQIEMLLGRPGYSRKVLLNLEKTTYIDSTGIGWLLMNHKRFLQAGGKLVLHSIPPMVYQVLQLLNLPSIVSMATNEATARAIALGETK
jgi:stage II sporulation protein AA (anti-sigma F factor antagonist)